MVTIYSRRGLQAKVLDVVGRRIVSGEVAEGEVLDLDAAETEFQVSRTVIREAVKVLSARGLLDARPRTGTFVLPRRSWNLLDPDVMAWRAASGLTTALLTELDELRHMVEPWAARLAATRRSDAALEEMRDALHRMEVAYAKFHENRVDSLPEHVQADIDFHTAMLRATGNELVSQMDVMLKPLLQFRDELIPEGEQSPSFLTAHTQVYEAIEEQDPDRAAASMTDLLDSAAHDLERLSTASEEKRGPRAT